MELDRARPFTRSGPAIHWPLAGSYSSDEVSTPLLLYPPDTSTCPEGNSVAVCVERATASAPAVDHVPVRGSYSSAVGVKLLKEVLHPPTTSTWPDFRTVAVCPEREFNIAGASDQVLLTGS